MLGIVSPQVEDVTIIAVEQQRPLTQSDDGTLEDLMLLFTLHHSSNFRVICELEEDRAGHIHGDVNVKEYEEP